MAEENLSFENIETPPGWDLFNDQNGAAAPEAKETGGQNEGGNEPQNDDNTAEVTRIPDDQLFPSNEDTQAGGESSPESVGGKNKQGEGASTAGSAGGESSANFYSSILGAFRRDGALEYLDDDDIASITDADTAREAIEKEVRGRLDERYRAIDEALGYGADVRELAQAQENLKFLSSVDPNSLDNDSDSGIAQLRKDLITNHYLALGMSQEQAEYELKKSMDTGNDIRDAKYALEMQRNFFQSEVDRIMNTAKAQEEARRQEAMQRQQRVSDNIMNNKDIFGGVTIDKRVREKIVDSIFTPKYRGEDGNYYTELQQYQRQHPDEWLQLMGMVYVMTDGGKNIGKMTGAIARKERNANIKNLENVLRGQTGGDGGLRFVENGRGEQPKEGARYTPVF